MASDKAGDAGNGAPPGFNPAVPMSGAGLSDWALNHPQSAKAPSLFRPYNIPSSNPSLFNTATSKAWPNEVPNRNQSLFNTAASEAWPNEVPNRTDPTNFLTLVTPQGAPPALVAVIKNGTYRIQQSADMMGDPSRVKALTLVGVPNLLVSSAFQDLQSGDTSDAYKNRLAALNSQNDTLQQNDAALTDLASKFAQTHDAAHTKVQRIVSDLNVTLKNAHPPSGSQFLDKGVVMTLMGDVGDAVGQVADALQGYVDSANTAKGKLPDYHVEKNTATNQTPAPQPAPTPTTTPDVAQILDKAVAAQHQKLDWHHSIVDTMKALGLDSSLQARTALAKHLNYTGDTTDSAAMNLWLHSQIMDKMAANGGAVPDDLKSAAA